MFCEKCGTQLPEIAQFCTNCGTSIKGEIKKSVTEKISDTEIQLRIKPTFKFGYSILPSAIIFGIIILFFSLMIGGAASSIEAGLGVFVFGNLFLLAILGIVTFFNKKQYDSYCYDFYKTKVVYKDSF